MRLESKILMVFTFFIGIFLLSSCSSSRTSLQEQETSLASFDREDYVLLPKVEGKVSSTKIWFLFIPFGGKSYDKLEQKAYNSAVEQLENADGLIETRYEHKKIVIPLIIFTPVIKKTTAIGRGYRLKEDGEL